MSAGVILEQQSELLGSGRYPIIVVDNASPDGSAQRIADQFPSVRVEKLRRNVGYGAAANVGIRASNTPYVLLLNPDLHAPLDVIDKLLVFASATGDDVAIVAPVTRPQDIEHQAAPRDVDWVLGAAMLFNVKAMASVGWFDENIFLFYEEKDLCLRVHNAGKRVVLVPYLCFKHLKASGSPRSNAIQHLKQWHVGWSSQYYFKKHNLAVGKRRPLRMLAEYLFRALTSLSAYKRKKFRARVKGVTAYLLGHSAFMNNGNPRGFKR